jgi:hypothetical protein
MLKNFSLLLVIDHQATRLRGMGKEKALCACAAAVCTYLREMVEEFVLLSSSSSLL